VASSATRKLWPSTAAASTRARSSGSRASRRACSAASMVGWELDRWRRAEGPAGWRPPGFQPRIAAAHEVGEGLLDEQRVAAGAREDRGGERLGLVGVLEAAQDQLAAGLLVELAQLDGVHAGERAQVASARGPGRAVHRPSSGRLCGPSSHSSSRRVAVLVDEVEVVEHDQHRAALAEAADQPADAAATADRGARAGRARCGSCWPPRGRARRRGRGRARRRRRSARRPRLGPRDAARAGCCGRGAK
jgi:hypothetical protein